jgi:copper chaperone NosL
MRAALVLALTLLLSACASVTPVPIRAGDVCFHCRRTITDPTLAAEVISQQGHAFKFSSVVCMTEYLREHPDEAVRATFVTDHTRGRMMPAERAWFVEFEVDPRVNLTDFAAFRDEEAAAAFARQHESAKIDWAAVKVARMEHGAH